MRQILRHLRFTVRSLRKSPGFAVAAVVTLALGIGANTAIFSIVYAVLLRPLPYADSARLVVVQESTPAVGTVSVSYPDFHDWRSQASRFSQMAFVHSTDFDLGGTSRPEAISADVVSPDFLSLLGVRPLLGRDFSASEEDPASDPVAILSYPLWKSRFAGDPEAVGETITLDGRSVTVIGVTPPGFRSLDKAEVLLPTGPWRARHPGADDRGARDDAVVIGRLAPGVSAGAARAEMGTIAARLAKAYPASNDQFGVSVEPLRDFFIGDARRLVLVLFGAVMFVLLIGCGNVANLLLSRRETRAREIAVRLALGASRLRLVAQMMIESLLLALFGGLLGVVLAVGGIRIVARLVPRALLGNAPLALNVAVLLFTLGITLLVALLLGIAPAMHHPETSMHSDLKEGRRAGAGRKVVASRGLLAGSEIALALALLVAAGLMVKSMASLLSVNPGFSTEHVLTATLNLRPPRYAKRDETLRFWRQLLHRAGVIPGVHQVGLGTVVPFTGDHDRSDITVEGMPLPSPGKFPHPDVHIVSPGYLGALGITLLRGRDFSRADDEGSPLVGIINSEVAHKYFPGLDPIGKRFMFGHPERGKSPKWINIVGEVASTKLYGLAHPARLEVYVPYSQHSPDWMTLVVRSALSPPSLSADIRTAVASVDRDQPIADIATMGELRAASVGDRRTALFFLGAFAGLAILLAAVGVYGVISYSVAQRTREIGIRMALGARPGDVLKMVLMQSGRIVIAGVAVGATAAVALTRFMTGFLYDVRPGDPLTVLIAASLVGSVALVASYVPAVRAVHVDPVVVLREE